VALTSVTILYKVLKLLIHTWPIKNGPKSLETFVVTFMCSIMELSNNSWGQRGRGNEVDPVLEVNVTCMEVSWSCHCSSLNFLLQFLHCQVNLDFVLNGFNPLRYGL
jgi:hypothetical protein